MDLLLVGRFVELPGLIAGHGYDVGGSTLGAPDGDDGASGIGTVSIVAVLLVSLVAVGAFVSLDPSGTFRRLKAAMPIGLSVALIVTPLAIWTATSGRDRSPFSVDRGNALTGAPELLISLVDETMNTLATTNGRNTVRLRCVDRDGRLVLDVEQRWPFIYERGYDYPHAHLTATLEQVLQADRCSFSGTRVRLEAAVQGTLAARALRTEAAD